MKPKDPVGTEAVFQLTESFLDRMESKGIGPTKLASLLGVSRSNVTDWFSPGGDLTVSEAAAIAQALDGKLSIAVEDDPTQTAERMIQAAAGGAVTEIRNVEASRRDGTVAELILGAKLRLAFDPNGKAVPV